MEPRPKLSPKNKIIDGSNKYLIPGLWDSHVHFYFDRQLALHMPELFLSTGITSVRDTGGNFTIWTVFDKMP